MRRSLLVLSAAILAVASPVLADPEPRSGGECDSSAGGEIGAEEALADEGPELTIETPLPTRWRASRGRECHRYRGRMMCDGPLRVPEPQGPAAERARALGLDDVSRVGRVALSQVPDPAWVAAAEGENGPGLLWPVPDGREWRGFGSHREIVRRAGGRRRQHMHRGVDIGAPAGSSIRAVNPGLVIYSDNGMSGYGNSVVILHPDQTVSLYAHCQATYVFAGQRVERGRVLGEVGHTGLAHGDHLHFEWRRNGRPLNPARHFVGGPEPRESRVSIAP